MSSMIRTILLCLICTAQAASAQSEPRRTITVSGVGRADVIPDVAFISVGVVERRPTANEALDVMSGMTAQVIDRLVTAGVDERDIQTGQLSLSPFYEQSSLNRNPKIAGFEAHTMLNVQVVDLDNAGKILDAVVEDGANRLGGIRFDVMEPEPHLDQARIEAVQRARAKAELYAMAAGLELGALISLTEGGTNSPQPMQMEMRMMDAASIVPIAGGDVSLSATVTLVYAIQE